jgi:hypothetical protein
VRESGDAELTGLASVLAGLTRFAAHLVGLWLAFLCALVGSGAGFHLARGPHLHGVCVPPPASCIARG